MKSRILILFLLSVSQFGYCQTEKSDYNFIIRRALEINIELSEYAQADSSGFAILSVAKNSDSIILKSLYSSYFKFNFANDVRLIAILNRYYKERIPHNYAVIIPIYFNYYYDGLIEYPKRAKEIFETMLEELKKQKEPVLEAIYITSYPTQR